MYLIFDNSGEKGCILLLILSDRCRLWTPYACKYIERGF